MIVRDALAVRQRHRRALRPCLDARLMTWIMAAWSGWFCIGWGITVAGGAVPLPHADVRAGGPAGVHCRAAATVRKRGICACCRCGLCLLACLLFCFNSYLYMLWALGAATSGKRCLFHGHTKGAPSGSIWELPRHRGPLTDAPPPFVCEAGPPGVRGGRLGAASLSPRPPPQPIGPSQAMHVFIRAIQAVLRRARMRHPIHKRGVHNHTHQPGAYCICAGSPDAGRA